MNTMTDMHRDRGFSVVELMIAITLGLLVIGIVATVFLSGNRNYAQDERFARMQENGRYAINRLTEDLSNIEYMGGLTGTGSPGIRDYANQATVLTNSNCGVDFALGNALRVLGNATGATANAAFGCIDASTFRNGTDVLLVQRVLSPPATPAAASPSENPFSTSRVYLRTNTSTGVLIKAASEPLDITSTFSIPSQNWTYWQYAPTVYYIQDTGVPSLHRLSLGSGLTMEDELLTDGVEAIHVLFGIDLDGDGIANQYKSNPTVDELAVAMNARIYVLVRSVDKDHGYTDGKTYTLGNLCYKVGGGGGCNTLTDASAISEPQKYHRRVFSSTVVLRNIAYRAQLKP
jgi:type IV pilus assembly protein PilW